MSQTTDQIVLSVMGKMKSVTAYPSDVSVLEGIQSYAFESSVQIGKLIGLDKHNLCELLNERSKVGIEKYGTSLQDAEFSEEEILLHTLNEFLDALNYLEKAIQVLK